MKGEEKAKGGGMLYGLSFMLFFIGFAMIIFFGGTANMVLLIFVLFGSISMLAGINMTAEPRSYLGLPFILMFLFIFTSQQPAIMGQAIFGYWWPQVQSFGDTYMPPLTNALDQAWKSLSKVGKMMTDPAGYFRDIQMENQATQSVITQGGTSLSIETNKVDLLPTVIGTLEPSEPVIGIIELENKGEFESGRVDLTLSNNWVNPTDSKEISVGTISNLKCSGSTYEGTSGNPLFCNWTSTTYPHELKASSFIINIGNAEDLRLCKDNVTSSCTCGSCIKETQTYKHAGEIVKFYTNLSYNYNVNVTIPFNIINQTLYMERLKIGNRVLMTNITSEYTGGPVKATLFIPNQPARTHWPQLVVASIYNDGAGELTRINNYTITFYGQYIESVEVIMKTFDDCNVSENTNITKTNNNFVIKCWHNSRSIKPQEYKRVSFYVTAIDSVEITEKTAQIIGKANYDYRKTNAQSLVVANNPPE